MNSIFYSPLYIAGQGSISSFCAAQAWKNNLDYLQICRDASSKKPVLVIDDQTNITLSEPIFLSESKLIKLLLVPLKAPDVVNFIQQVQPYLASDCHIILSHNGMGTIELVDQILPQSCRLYFCTTNNGAFKEQNTVTIAGYGQTFWSEITRRNNLPNSDFKSLTNEDMALFFPDCEHQSDLNQILWKKLLVNCVINPLTALYGIKNGELLNPRYKKEIEAITDEFLSVAKTEKVTLEKEQAKQLIKQVCKQTASNTSSMLQDVKSGRTTEIDYITGFIINRSKQHNLSLPTCGRLYEAIKSLQVSG